MGFCSDNHISAISSYARIKYGKDVFSKHFLLRAYQRFPIEERNAIFAELHDLIRTGMYQHLFSPGSKSCNMLIQNKYEVVFTMNGKQLCMKTIFVPNKTRLANLKKNFDGSKPSSD